MQTSEGDGSACVLCTGSYMEFHEARFSWRLVSQHDGENSMSHVWCFWGNTAGLFSGGERGTLVKWKLMMMLMAIGAEVDRYCGLIVGG